MVSLADKTGVGSYPVVVQIRLSVELHLQLTRKPPAHITCFLAFKGGPTQ